LQRVAICPINESDESLARKQRKGFFAKSRKAAEYDIVMREAVRRILEGSIDEDFEQRKKSTKERKKVFANRSEIEKLRDEDNVEGTTRRILV